MQPLRADEGAAVPSQAGKLCLENLRRTIARMETPATAFGGPGDCPLGVPEIDRALGGGLARGALHEIAARHEAHVAAASGFALGIATQLLHLPLEGGGMPPGLTRGSTGPDQVGARLRGREGVNREAILVTPPRIAYGDPTLPLQGRVGTIIWIVEDMGQIESGALYGPGIDDFGLAPERLLTVAAAKTDDVLWVMEEALRCHAVGVVIGELRGTSRALDLVATRRLSLAAAEHGALALLLRSAPGDEACAAVTRWVVCASPGGSIGPPRFDLALTRNRRGPLGSWMLEWSIVDASFILAAHPQPMARTVVDRPHQAQAA